MHRQNQSLLYFALSANSRDTNSRVTLLDYPAGFLPVLRQLPTQRIICEVTMFCTRYLYFRKLLSTKYMHLQTHTDYFGISLNRHPIMATR